MSDGPHSHESTLLVIHRKNTPWRRAAFVGLALLIWSSPEIVCGSSDPLPVNKPQEKPAYPFPMDLLNE